MKLKLLFVFLFLFSFQTFAQDKKWSIETNYSVVPQDGFGGGDNVLDLGLKYRFVDFDFVQLGIGVNTGFSKDKYEGSNLAVVGETNGFYFQPRAFAEFIIPGIEKLRPTVGLGYSIVNSDTDLVSLGEPIISNTTNGGFNFNFGLSYDITKRFFIQAQYDFINLRVKDEFIFQGELVQPNFIEKLNNIIIGVGFRF